MYNEDLGASIPLLRPVATSATGNGISINLNNYTYGYAQQGGKITGTPIMCVKNVQTSIPSDNTVIEVIDQGCVVGSICGSGAAWSTCVVIAPPVNFTPYDN